MEELWFAFDRDGDGDSPIIDEFLAEAEISDGERAFLTALRRSSMRMYEVVDAVPGVSLTLRDVIEGGQVTVNERQGSRSISRHQHLAVRVVPRGPSGGPEIESGSLHIPDLVKDAVAAQLRRDRARFLDEHRGAAIDAFYKATPPFFHEVWAGSFLDAQVPHVKTTDGEDLIPTTVRFDVADGEALALGLDACAELEPDGEAWTWSGANRDGKPTIFGWIRRSGDRLTLETNSVERAARGRTMLEALAGSAIRHRATAHENLQLDVKQRIPRSACRRPRARAAVRRLLIPAPVAPQAWQATRARIARHRRAGWYAPLRPASVVATAAATDRPGPYSPAAPRSASNVLSA